MKEREKIRYRLSINHLSFAWLIDMLRKRGIETNGPVLSAILAGTRNGPSVDKIIAESIDILDWYERQIVCHERQCICPGSARTGQSVQLTPCSICPRVFQGRSEP